VIFDTIPDVIQKMMVKLSMGEDHCLPQGPYKEYETSNTLGATMVLSIKLSIRACQVDVSISMAHAIRACNFQGLQLSRKFHIGGTFSMSLMQMQLHPPHQ
jgi:hypothetical protein